MTPLGLIFELDKLLHDEEHVQIERFVVGKLSAKWFQHHHFRFRRSFLPWGASAVLLYVIKL